MFQEKIMMRVVFSNYDDVKNPYYGGGGAIAIHEVAKHLHGSFHILVITGKYPKCKKEETRDGVLYKRIGISWMPPKLAQLFYQFLLPFYVRKESFDIWVESFTPPFSTACLQLFTRKPVIGLTHSLSGKEMSRKYSLPFYVFESLGLQAYRYVIALSEALRENIQKRNNNIHIAVIPNGVEKELLNRAPKDKEELILFLGRVDVYQKGLDILFLAYEKFHSSIPYPLVIAGAGLEHDEQFIKKKIRESSIENKIRYLGKVVGEEKYQLFEKSAFLVSPSRMENFPLTVLEAFCFGLPAVLTDIAGYAWVPDTCAIKIKNHDPDSLGKAIVHMAEDVSARRHRGEAAKRFVQTLSWDRIANEYGIFFQQVLQEHHNTQKENS